MSTGLSFPFKLLFTVIGTLFRIIGLLLGFSLRTLRFAGGRVGALLIGAVLALFLGKKYLENKSQEGK